MRRNWATEIAQAFNLGMSPPCFAMMSFRHYFVVDYQDGADCGIWSGHAERPFCFIQRCAHELFVRFRSHRSGKSTNG
jgi:hypothetical protein